jgi:hypothetical protein
LVICSRGGVFPVILSPEIVYQYKSNPLFGMGNSISEIIQDLMGRYIEWLSKVDEKILLGGIYG